MKSCSSWRSDLASSIFCWQNTTVRRGRRDGPLHRLAAHWLEPSHVTQSWPLIGWPACREGWESYYCKLQLEKRKWYRVDNCTGPNLQINFTVGTKYFQRANLICLIFEATIHFIGYQLLVTVGRETFQMDELTTFTLSNSIQRRKRRSEC